MATTVYKVLGQVAPATSATAVTLYTVPASTQTIVSTIAVANRGAQVALFRIAIRPAGATLDPKHYLTYDSQVPANDSVMFTIGVTLATTDVITVQANTTTVSFSAFGSEIS